MEPEAGAAEGAGGITDAQADQFLSDTLLEAVMGSFMMKKIQEAAREFREEK
ncbi:MAG: hypothetical protein ABJM43_19800 [Paracoccaceae bacterium]